SSDPGNQPRHAARQSASAVVGLLAPLAVGVAVAIALGVFARVHDATGHAIDVPGFSSTLSVKTWLTTLAVVLAIVQIVTAGGLVAATLIALWLTSALWYFDAHGFGA